MTDEIDFVEPDRVPQPPEAVHIESLRARVYPDGRRVRVDVRLTPFLERPNLELFITNAEGQEVAAASVIQSMDYRLEMTIHLRGPQPAGRHTLRAELFFPPPDPGASPGPDPTRKVSEIAFDVEPAAG